MRVGGIVLCGGRSSRMGQPKAWLPFGEEVLLQRVVGRVRQVAEPVVVVAAPTQDVPTLPTDVDVVRDSKEHRGPLAGLHSGLSALRDRAEVGYLSSCDVPFLRPAFIRRAIELLGEHAICVPHVDGHYHPLAALYRIEVLDAVTQLLAENRLRPFFLFEQFPTRTVTEADFADVDPGMRSLRNVNTPEEYESALRENTEEN